MSIQNMAEQEFNRIRDQYNAATQNNQYPNREAIAQAYREIRNYGHLYPNLALSLVEPQNGGFSGRAALEHLQETLESQGRQRLPESGQVRVMGTMLVSYMNYLGHQLNDFPDRIIYREIEGTETLDFHSEGFTELGSLPQSWTLYVPYTIMREINGDAYVNRNFEGVLSSIGNRGAELVQTMSIASEMAVISSAMNSIIQESMRDTSEMERQKGEIDKWLLNVGIDKNTLFDFLTTFYTLPIADFLDWMQVHNAPEGILSLNPLIPHDTDQNGIPDAIQYPSPYNQRKQPTPWDLDGNGIPDSIQRDPIPEWQRELNRVLNFFRRDPLTLDLDGNNQLETLAENGSQGVMFDHDGDGIRTPTGWIGTNDGFLVLDHNGNGVIDNGTELFGDSTLIFTTDDNGQIQTRNARHGFDALAALDDNQDGMVNAQDAAFAQLQVWQDLNSNGISEAGELLSLQAAGVESLDTTFTQNGAIDGNGNQIAEEGIFIRTDGSVAMMADLNFTETLYERTFTEALTLSDEVKELPNMQGFGRVRDLREAAMQSSHLLALLQAYDSADTREDQRLFLMPVLDAWSQTSDSSTVRERFENSNYDFRGFENYRYYRNRYLLLTEQDQQAIHILEGFSGRRVPLVTQPVYDWVSVPRWDASRNEVVYVNESHLVGYSVGLASGQRELINQSINSLQEFVYNSLLPQSNRITNYRDEIQIYFNESGNVELNFEEISQRFRTLAETDAANAVLDLVEFNRIYATRLDNQGWNGYQLLREIVSAAENTPALQQAVALFNINLLDESDSETVNIGGINQITILNADHDFTASSTGNQIIIGGDENDTIHVQGQANRIYAGHGDNVVMVDNAYYQENTGTFIRTESGNDIIGGIINNGAVFTGAGNDLVTANNEGLAYVTNSQIDTGAGDDSIHLSSISQSRIETGTGNDFIAGSVGSNLSVDESSLITSGGDDIIFATVNQAFIQTGDGNDELHLAGRDIILSADRGEDLIELTGTSNVTINYNLGDGNDIIEFTELHHSSNTRIVFGIGIEKEDFSFERSDNNLLIYFQNQILTIENVFNQAATVFNGTFSSYQAATTNYIQQMVFADGSTLELADILRNLPVYGTDESETIYGTGHEQHRGEIIFAGAGDDRIIGRNHSFNGVEIYDGGAGNDTLVAELGSVLLTGGTGNDNLIAANNRFGVPSTISVDSVYVTENANTAALFSDVTIFTLNLGNQENTDAIFSAFTLYPWLGSFYNGGQGNDALLNGESNDVFYFTVGDGQDTLSNVLLLNPNEYGYATEQYYGNHGGFDRVVFGAGIRLQDLRFEYSQSVFTDEYGYHDLTIFYGETDSITIDNWFGNHNNGIIEQFEFADGAILSGQELSRLALGHQGTEQNDVMMGLLGTVNNLNGLGGNDSIQGGHYNDVISGGLGNDIINGMGGNNTLNGDEGDDILISSYGNNLLYGGAGDDTINSSGGDNTVDGGRGNDYLQQSYGNTLYQVGADDGQDVISDTDSQFHIYGNYYISNYTDTLVFTDFTSSQVYVARENNDVVFGNHLNTSTVRVQNWYLRDSNHTIEIVRFADNIIWTAAQIEQTLLPALQVTHYLGNEVSEILNLDIIEGSTVDAGAGNDVINLAGNGILQAGAGDDVINILPTGYLEQGYQVAPTAITIQYNLGDGNDVINADFAQASLRFGEGILLQQLQFSRNNNDLLIRISGNSQYITLQNQFGSYGTSFNYSILSNLIFADGSSMQIGQSYDWIETLGTTSGDDLISAAGYSLGATEIIIGYEGNDFILGSEYKDSIDGNEGDDTLVGGRGDNYLYGGEGNDILQTSYIADYYFEFYGNGVSEGSFSIYLGGLGDDIIIGGYGDSIIMYEQGDGNDIIANHYAFEGQNNTLNINLGIGAANGDDTLQVGFGLTLQETRFIQSSENQNNLIIQFEDESQIILLDWFLSEEGKKPIDGINFFEGGYISSLDINHFIEYLVSNEDDSSIEENYPSSEDEYSSRTFYGSFYDDYIAGNLGNDVFYGMDGNDYLSGLDGIDLFFGGYGDDTLLGGIGSDAYVFYQNEGIDTIIEDMENTEDYNRVFFNDLSSDQIQFSRQDANLVVLNPTGSLVIQNFFASSDYYNIADFYFTDVQISAAQIAAIFDQETPISVTAKNTEQFMMLQESMITQLLSSFEVQESFSLSQDNSSSLEDRHWLSFATQNDQRVWLQ